MTEASGKFADFVFCELDESLGSWKHQVINAHEKAVAEAVRKAKEELRKEIGLFLDGLDCGCGGDVESIIDRSLEVKP